MGRLLRRHWLFALVLAAAAVLRAAMERAFGPAFMYLGDSLDYINVAYGHHFDEGHPLGYPAILFFLGLPGRSLWTISILQHLAGLATGVLVYALLLRLRVHPIVAAAASALVLLNSWTIVLEQHVMAEAFFTLALFAAVALVVIRQDATATAFSGLLLAAATLMRVAGLFAIPVWLVYIAWKGRAPRAIATAGAAVLIPLVGYLSVHAAVGRGFAFTEWDGWLLYGRVAEIAHCRVMDVPKGTRPLCESPKLRAHRRFEQWTPSAYVFRAKSPAHRLYGDAVTAGPNAQLKRFAIAAIRARPLAYLHIVGRDFTYYFRPAYWRRGFDPGIVLYEQDRRRHYLDWSSILRTYFPGYTIAKAWPMHAVVKVSWRTRPPRPLLAALTLSALVSMLLAVAGRGRFSLPRQAESTFFVLLALTILLVSTAVVELNLRFLVPVLPLIACAGALSVTDLGALVLAAWRGHRRRDTARAEPAAR